ncbi:P-loop containing nucleoside triphosphate hydrolase protein [Tilletiopsis washingtonensis]|uniref:P-loop containing nucleoside triphosphate hydrolase protein n=1 Tax=Tilletiopsis washingtonensis TaxID=58919 RepID=A0A316Z7I3_9BASI|nr:P-loop containing nucleoside triphosphate hydrolase protein [Tilletiopsis washingtonensis]PWN97559.1 P-loop containing nucleoside triphosphate hydrolase protein [Tilletiopsis washingtonensis]
MSVPKEYKIVLAGPFASGRTAFAAAASKAEKKSIKSLRADTFKVPLYTSAGSVVLTLYDTTMHAKGGLPADDFFRNADAAVVFFAANDRDSLEKSEEWYDAVVEANRRRGSEPTPILFAGTKVDDLSNLIKPADIDVPRKREVKYVEISAKAGYGVKELYTEICRMLLGGTVQLTDVLELQSSSASVDEEALEKRKKEYEEAAKP